MLLLFQDSEILNEGAKALEKITNPILVILILTFISIIVFGYRYFSTTLKEKDKSIKEKDDRLMEYLKLIGEISKEGSKVIVELNNTLDKLTEADKSYASKLGISNDLLQQLLAKIDTLLKFNSK